tara:strand:+ start:1970 stop:2428 length:459 start_codon:yes stop_codon:yes gene_type:complete
MNLNKNEKILVDTPICKLTNQRVITGKTSNKNIFSKKKETSFSDIHNIEIMMHQGEENRIKEGIKYFTVGLGILIAISLIPFLNNIFQTIFFIIGIIPLIYGLYIIPKSIFRLKEHSTLFLWLKNGKCIIISFPKFDDENILKIQSQLNELM